MRPRALLPIAAGFAATIVSVTRRSSALLLESSLTTPSIEMVPLIVLGSRFVAFLLVYGLVFGVAYRIGAHHVDARADGMLALGTGIIGAATYFVGTGTVLLMLGEPADTGNRTRDDRVQSRCRCSAGCRRVCRPRARPSTIVNASLGERSDSQ